MNHRVSFFGVAAAKSGTTWLHSCLAEHPEVFMPEVKELDFFSESFLSGIENYQSHFQLASASQVCGEFSPSYGPHPDAAKRLFEYNPSAKLIWMLREPVDRAYSHYCMACRTQKQILPVKDVLKLESDFVRYGEYANQLKHFLKFFPIEQHLIIRYEDLNAQDSGASVLRSVFEFLEIDSSFLPSILGKKLNTRKKIGRFPAAFNFAKNTAIKLSSHSKLLEKLLQKFRTSSAMAVIHQINSAPLEFEALDEELKQKLESHYIPFNIELQKTMASDKPMWVY